MVRKECSVNACRFHGRGPRSRVVEGKCGHEWQTAIGNRCISGTGCPYCTTRTTLKGFNDLVTLRPDQAKEWNYERNGELKPEDFRPFSRTRIWWQCKKDHEWESTIGNRVRGNGCPVCAKEPEIKGVNDFKTSYPELLKYWSEKNEIDPSDIRASYRKQVWWNCGQCGNEYLAQPHSVISRKGIGCKRCQSTVGKGWKDLMNEEERIRKNYFQLVNNQ